MTGKELIDKFCKYRGKCTTDDVVALTYAYKSLQLDFINKASEWLDGYLTFSVAEWDEGVTTQRVIDKFRKAMKGGEE